MTALLEQVGAWDGGATLTRCNGLDNTTQVRSAYLCHQKHLSNVRKIYPLRQWFRLGELAFAQDCHRLVSEGEEAVTRCVACLTPVRTDKLDWTPLDTLSAYLLDWDSSVTQTAEQLGMTQVQVSRREKKLLLAMRQKLL